MELIINIENGNIKIEAEKFQKMIFVFNALEAGWTIKKRNDSFIFSKNHEGKKEIFSDSYLNGFMKTNLDLSNLLG
jgi:hypothetical protein